LPSRTSYERSCPELRQATVANGRCTDPHGPDDATILDVVVRDGDVADDDGTPDALVRVDYYFGAGTAAPQAFVYAMVKHRVTKIDTFDGSVCLLRSCARHHRCLDTTRL